MEGDEGMKGLVRGMQGWEDEAKQWVGKEGVRETIESDEERQAG